MVLKFLHNALFDEEFKQKLEFIRSISVFSGLGRKEASEILSIIYEKKYAKGEIIFEEGKIGKALYIVKEGAVAVSSNGKEICILHQHDFFGEMVLLEEITRSATTMAHTDCTLLLIYKVRFDALIEKDPGAGVRIVRNIARILSKRLRQSNQAYMDMLSVPEAPGAQL